MCIRDRRAYMLNYFSMMMAISSIFLTLDGSKAALAKRRQLWDDLKAHDGHLYRRCRFSVAEGCNPVSYTHLQSGFVHAFAREPFFFKHILQSRHCADALRRWLLWNIYCRPRPARLTQDTLSRIYRRVYPCWM